MEINKENYKECLVRYLEKDMDIAKKIETEQFIKENDWAAQEWDLLKRTRLKPNMEIRFPDKKLLFRSEEPVAELKRPVIAFKIYRYAALAAAAAFLAFAIIFTIRKPGNRIETAHSNIHNPLIPNVKQPENPQAQVLSQQEKIIVPDHVQQYVPVQKHSAAKKNFVANEKQPINNRPEQNPEQKKKTNLPMRQPVLNNKYATEKLPAVKSTDSQVINHPILETQEAVNQVAVAKKSPASTPVKVAANTSGNDKTLLQSFLELLHKISIKKEVVNDQTYYALSIETPDIKINKTIK